MFLYSIAKFFENPYREDLNVRINLLFSLVVNIIMWLAIYYKLEPFSYLAEFGQIYLHYNLYFGIDNIGPWYMVFALPVLGLLVIVINNILAYIFYLQEKVVSLVLVFSQSVVQIILLAATIFIILLNV